MCRTCRSWPFSYARNAGRKRRKLLIYDQFKKFDHKNYIKLYDGSLDQEALVSTFNFVSAWLPSDLLDFYVNLGDPEVGRIEVIPPAPFFDSSNALRNLNRKLTEARISSEDFFAIAYLNEYSYIFIQRILDGGFRSGKYNFTKLQCMVGGH